VLVLSLVEERRRKIEERERGVYIYEESVPQLPAKRDYLSWRKVAEFQPQF